MKLLHPKIGTKRITNSFLILPLRIGDESRWFETVRYEEEFMQILNSETKFYEHKWIPKRWINE